MTIDELLSLAGLTANDEIPVWDAEAADEPTKKIKAQNLAVSVKALAGLVGEAELTEQLADKADVIVDTASGAIASFPDGAAVAAKDVTIGIEPVQSGSGDPSPENVRPISGWTGANVSRAGKNLFDKTRFKFAKGYLDGYGVWQGSRDVLVYPDADIDRNWNSLLIDVADFEGETITYSGFVSQGGVLSGLVDENFSLLLNLGGSSVSGRTVNLASYPTAKYLTLGFFGRNYSHDSAQLELGSTASIYEPYAGTTFPITFPSEAGTVYGGTLDVTTGLLTVTMAEVDLGTLNWSKDSQSRWFGLTYAGQIPNLKGVTNNDEIANIICTNYRSTSRNNITSGNGICVNVQNSVLIADSYMLANYDAAAFKTAMSGVYLVYELATPQTYQLAPTEVDLLLGENNVWADTGDSTVTYRADTKLYIQKINAPTDDDMIADVQIASGKYFIVGGNLYRSTTTIPAGDVINPGSNCILTNLADALNALNT